MMIDKLLIGLAIMGKGMLGIFAAIILIILAVVILQKIGKKVSS